MRTSLNLTKSREVAWSEKELEDWLWRNPMFPGGEKLLPVLKQRPIARVIDLLFLDQNRRLVLVEIKNERSTRLAVGQVLEYLSKYHDYDIDELCDDSGRDLRAEFGELFKQPLESLSEQRRVILAAPGFDAPSAVACVYLNHALRNVQVSMIKAIRTNAGFNVSLHQAPNLVPPRKLARGSFAVSPTGRKAFLVLEDGANPLVWWIGRVKHNGKLSLPSQRHSILQRLHRRVVPAEGVESVDLSHQGSVFQRKDNAEHLARVLGHVSTSFGEQVVILRIRPGKSPVVRVIRKVRFKRDWVTSKMPFPDWAEFEKLLRDRITSDVSVRPVSQKGGVSIKNAQSGAHSSRRPVKPKALSGLAQRD